LSLTWLTNSSWTIYIQLPLMRSFTGWVWKVPSPYFFLQFPRNQLRTMSDYYRVVRTSFWLGIHFWLPSWIRHIGYKYFFSNAKVRLWPITSNKNFMLSTMPQSIWRNINPLKSYEEILKINFWILFLRTQCWMWP
jgi:hypothetical protein